MKKINVLQFICSTGFYGAERWVLALVNHLDPSKVRSDLVVTQEGNYKELKIVQQFNIENGQTFELPMAHKFDFSVVNKLVDLIKARDIDVIHTHGYKSDILGIMAARKANIKVVVTPHGFPAHIDFKLKCFIWFGCQSLRFANKVVPLSIQLMEDVKRFGVHKSKISYVQNGVDLSEVEAQQKLPIKSDFIHNEVKRIGFVGQMIKRKNIEHVLDVFESLSKKHDNLELYLLGDGESREGLEEYTKTLNSRNNIHFLGFRDDRLEWLQSFDLFVMTSLLEGIPRCVMETMAMGVPVSAYNIAGVDQLITHNETGLLANLNDKVVLEQHWETLLFNDEFSENIVINAKKFVYKHYSAQRMANEYNEIFNSLMD
jgi:glycosyltransferase involved in cell wall biosynthesis